MPYLLDSDVLIDISRRNANARAFVDSLPTAWAISQISAMEMIVGARDKQDVTNIETFLSGYVVVPVGESICTRAYHLLKSYSKSHGLHVFDSLIAATALQEDLTLVSKNRKHFAMIDGLKLQVPEY